MHGQAGGGAVNMTCPYCGREMKAGILSGDGRSPVTWKQGEKRAGILDTIVGSGTVTAARRNRAGAHSNHRCTG